ncbi:MAG: hypothetical protein LBR94_00925 [Desulfovibrio sp.]|jgi:hypothetical protein|nr:hypothetical protein [Desulfovibrio sp.]
MPNADGFDGDWVRTGSFTDPKKKGKYGENYDKFRPGRTRKVSFGLPDKARVVIEWDDPNGVTQDLRDAIELELTPVLKKIASSARKRVHVGGKRRGPPKWVILKDKNGKPIMVEDEKTGKERPLVVDVNSPRDPREAYKTGPHALQPYTARDPGTLRNSIEYYVVTTYDKKAVIGYVSAGNDNTDYAFLEELGVRGRSGGSRAGHAFLRPALHEHMAEGMEAINMALNSL